MDNVPAGLDSMYVLVEESVITQGARNILYSGVQAVTSPNVEIDIGENGTVGAGVIVTANNFTTGGQSFKSMAGYTTIEAGGVVPPDESWYDSTTGLINPDIVITNFEEPIQWL